MADSQRLLDKYEQALEALRPKLEDMEKERDDKAELVKKLEQENGRLMSRIACLEEEVMTLKRDAPGHLTFKLEAAETHLYNHYQVSVQRSLRTLNITSPYVFGKNPAFTWPKEDGRRMACQKFVSILRNTALGDFVKSCNPEGCRLDDLDADFVQIIANHLTITRDKGVTPQDTVKVRRRTQQQQDASPLEKCLHFGQRDRDMPEFFEFLGLPADAEVSQYQQKDMVEQWVKHLGSSISGMVEAHKKFWEKDKDRHLRMKECYDTACKKMLDFAEHRMEGIRDANARNHFVAETFQATWSFIFSSFASSFFHVRHEVICDYLPDGAHPLHEFLVKHGVHFQHSRRLPESLWWKNDHIQRHAAAMCFTPLQGFEIPEGPDEWAQIKANTEWLRTAPAFRALVDTCYENDFYHLADSVRDQHKTPYKPDRLYPPHCGRDMIYWILSSDIANFIRLYVEVARVTEDLEKAGIHLGGPDDERVKPFLSKLSPAKMSEDLRETHTRIPGYSDGNYVSEAVQITCDDVIKHLQAWRAQLMLTEGKGTSVNKHYLHQWRNKTRTKTCDRLHQWSNNVTVSLTNLHQWRL